jgi:hypothetical protein
MPQLIKNETFADGELVTGLRLNNIIDLATLGTQSITAQTAVSSFDIQSSDYLLVYDSSANALRKASIDDIFRSGQTVKYAGISGIAGADLAVAIASGFSFVINGNTNIPANLTVTGLVQGGTGKFTTELTIPAGTTATRPASPVAGSVRLNTDTGFTEVWNGTTWTNSSILGTENTFTAKNTFSNTADVTGAFKVNDRVGFALYQVYEESIPYAAQYGTGGGVVWTSQLFTKPIDEIWVIDIDVVIYTGIRNTSVNWGYPNFSFLNGGIILTGSNSPSGTMVLNVGTTKTLDAITLALTYAQVIPSVGGLGDDKLRIYKYKTASNSMLTGKSYTNNGTSVTVTSTAHGLSAGQYINVYADKSSLSGRYILTSAATDTFTYANSTAAGSGTLAYIA